MNILLKNLRPSMLRKINPKITQHMKTLRVKMWPHVLWFTVT